MALARFQPYSAISDKWFRRKQWRWRFIARNNKIISVSAEGYNNHGDCMHSIEVMVSEIQKGAIIEARPPNGEDD